METVDDLLLFDGVGGIMEEKKKLKSNTEEDYNKALASDDPTKITPEDLEKLAKDAVKKFKLL